MVPYRTFLEKWKTIKVREKWQCISIKLYKLCLTHLPPLPPPLLLLHQIQQDQPLPFLLILSLLNMTITKMKTLVMVYFYLSSVQSFSCVRLFVTPWTAAHQASLSVTNSQSLFKLVYWIGDAIQPSHPLSSPSPSASIFPSMRVFSNETDLRIRWPKYWGFTSTSVLPVNIQDWFPLGWTGWISLQSKGLSRVFSNTTVQSINSLVLSFLYSSTLTSIHDYWKNHSLDETDLCWQSNVSAF